MTKIFVIKSHVTSRYELTIYTENFTNYAYDTNLQAELYWHGSSVELRTRSKKLDETSESVLFLQDSALPDSASLLQRESLEPVPDSITLEVDPIAWGTAMKDCGAQLGRHLGSMVRWSARHLHGSYSE